MIKLSSLTGRPAHPGGCYHCKGGTKMCICPGQQSKPGTPDMFAEYRGELPPGHAFIFAGDLERHTTDPDYFRAAFGVPRGYIWQPSTESTGAGWVRPSGSRTSTPRSV